MQPEKKAKQLLSESPVPSLRDGLHRAGLKRELMARWQKGRVMSGGTSAMGMGLERAAWLAAAAAVALVGGVILVVQISHKEPVRPPVRVSESGAAGAATRGDPRMPTAGPRAMELRRRSLEQSVAQAQVIVVATALDFSQAPPHVKGDAPENFIRFKVVRVLKGKLTREIVTTRTPTNGAEFVGHDWVLLLSPEFVAGKHPYAECCGIGLEGAIKAAVAKQGAGAE